VCHISLDVNLWHPQARKDTQKTSTYEFAYRQKILLHYKFALKNVPTKPYKAQ